MKTKDFCGIDVELLLRQRKIPGVSAAFSHNGKIEHFTCGTGRFGQTYPIVADTLFQAASISKLVFSMLVMRLADERVLCPDEDISGVVGEYSDGPVTFRQLLSHTAGYNVHGFNGYPSIIKAPISPEQVLSGEGNSPKVERVLPIGQYYYSGGGYELAELALIRMTGKSLRQLAEEKIFAPLGMMQSGYFQPLNEEKRKFAAHAGPCEDLPPGCDYMYHPEQAAAGLWATPQELVTVGLALSRSCRESGFLKRETALDMMRPIRENYGLGVMQYPELGDEMFGHSGENIGFTALLIYSTRELFAAVVCANGDDCGETVYQIARAIVQNKCSYTGAGRFPKS